MTVWEWTKVASKLITTSPIQGLNDRCPIMIVLCEILVEASGPVG